MNILCLVVMLPYFQHLLNIDFYCLNESRFTRCLQLFAATYVSKSKTSQLLICEVVRTIILVVVIIPCWSLLLRVRGPLQNIRVKQLCMMFQKLLNVPVVRVTTVATA